MLFTSQNIGKPNSEMHDVSKFKSIIIIIVSIISNIYNINKSNKKICNRYYNWMTLENVNFQLNHFLYYFEFPKIH